VHSPRYPRAARKPLGPMTGNVQQESIETLSVIPECDLGYIDLEQKTLHPLDKPFGPNV
jgi:hypothetical protein